MASVLIIGAYGFIGAEVTRSLLSTGHQVQVLGRDAHLLAGLGAQTVWCRDLRNMTRPEDWMPILDTVDVVVNAAGVLQDGPGDDVERVQRYAIAAMAQAAASAGVQRIVQISAVGADPQANTAFMSSKGTADAALMAGPVETVVLRPGLVLGRSVYGGTALLRMLAAVPLVQPIAHGDAPIQTVAMADVVKAVSMSVDGDLAGDASYDLVAEEPVPLRELVAVLRKWLGFPAAWRTLTIGNSLAAMVSRGTDLLGALGWRSPLRSTALATLRSGVTGDPTAWNATGHPPCRSLEETLLATPATLQDRVHARVSMAMPLVVATLSVFWLLSGIIGVYSFDEACRILIYRGFLDQMAQIFVASGCFADLLLGLCVIVKRWARPAMLGMVAVSLGYIVAGALWTPDLWTDPLGPFVKVLPAIMLAGIGYLMLEDR